jgi:formamidopyrimidine-DNA glycosylase
MNIKNIMMDNKIVVGVGNIYINESLFLSNISPNRPANKISKKELEKLIFNIKNILQRAIDKGGSTLRDYKKLNGDIGNFQFDFMVYGREGKDCYICQNKIQRIKQNGRSTFFCNNCQPA